MKQLARRYCFWKGIDRDIERMVRSCEACVQVQSKPAKAPLHQWEEPAENWERIHIDYAGPFQDHFFLIVVDAKSRWAEVRTIRDAPTTQTSINLLSDIFSTHGFPVIMVSDNATIFTSDQFRTYCKKNAIFQKLIAPGHPSTNGLAERNVQTLKRKLKAMSAEPGSLQKKINEIMQRYRATPLSSGKSPAELYFNRRIRIRLDALKPPIKFKPTTPIPGVRQISVGERVQVLHIRNNKTVWKTGTVTNRFGLLHYMVKLDDGYTLKRHINQIKSTKVQQRKVHFSPEIERETSTQNTNLYSQHRFEATIPQNQHESEIQADELPRSQEMPDEPQEQIMRRSERTRNRPTYLRDYTS